MYFKVKQTNIKPRKGTILVSEPFSRDKYFKRSVILLTVSEPDGTIGFVLNRYVRISFANMLRETIDFDAPVSIGGPVATDRLDYIHCLGEKIPNSRHIVGNIYWGGDFNVILDFIKLGIINEDEIKFFVGYAGWSKGQLNNELKQKLWLVSNAKPDTLLEKDDKYWRNTIKSMGKDYSSWLNLPEDPQLN